MDAVNAARLRVWKQQPDTFYQEALLDADGTNIGTDATIEGVDLAWPTLAFGAITRC